MQEVKQDISDQKLITELAAVKKCLNEKELLWAQIEESLKKQCTYQEDQNTQLQQENSSLKQLVEVKISSTTNLQFYFILFITSNAITING